MGIKLIKTWLSACLHNASLPGSSGNSYGATSYSVCMVWIIVCIITTKAVHATIYLQKLYLHCNLFQVRQEDNENNVCVGLYSCFCCDCFGAIGQVLIQ